MWHIQVYAMCRGIQDIVMLLKTSRIEDSDLLGWYAVTPIDVAYHP
jgi:hypothetical protein